MKIAYKGFDKNLKCKNKQFKIGSIHTIDNDKELKSGTNSGYHYCNKLEDVLKYYPNNGSNRFCQIEILGDFQDDNDKSITKKFRIIKEIDVSVLDYLQHRVDREKQDDRMRLKIVRQLQNKYPQFHVGGSIALYLYGIRLERWEESGYWCDIDMVSPYYTYIEDTKDFEIKQYNGKASGNDFDDTYIIDKSIRMDFKVDPKQRYEYIRYNGFMYKVSTLETIMEAKFRYALNRQNKHKEDCREICLK